MPSPSVTYTFSNSTTADATQVNQNFTDIINGITDGTKDLAISALTCSGNVSFNGNTTIGNASSDDLTVTASLASSIPIKTTNSYDIGSATLGLRYLYFGQSGGSNTAKITHSSLASDITLTLPAETGTLAVYRDSSEQLFNVGLSASVAANALTIALKQSDGSTDPATGSGKVLIGFRNSTATSGAYEIASVTSSLSVTVSSGSTLGSKNSTAFDVYVYAINNGGTVELGVVGASMLDEGTLQSSTAEGGAGAADTAGVLYSTTARTSKAVRLLGRVRSTQTTAGTWASSPSEVALIPMRKDVYINARYKTSAGQSITNAGSPQIIDFGTKDFDDFNGGTTGASWKWTSPITAKYQINAQLFLTGGGWASTEYADIRIYKNGSQVSTQLFFQNSTHSNGVPMAINDIVSMTAGDYIDIRCYQTSGGTVPLVTDANYNFISLTKVGT